VTSEAQVLSTDALAAQEDQEAGTSQSQMVSVAASAADAAEATVLAVSPGDQPSSAGLSQQSSAGPPSRGRAAPAASAEWPSLVTLPCGHTFHGLCIREWLSYKGAGATCPLCKQSLFAAPASEV
jgi:hypothetical protein